MQQHAGTNSASETSYEIARRKSPSPSSCDPPRRRPVSGNGGVIRTNQNSILGVFVKGVRGPFDVGMGFAPRRHQNRWFFPRKDSRCRGPLTSRSLATLLKVIVDG